MFGGLKEAVHASTTLGICVLTFAGLLLSATHLSIPLRPRCRVPYASHCALADLSGTYGFVRTGETPQGASAVIAVGYFDGESNSTVAQPTNRNGTIPR